MEKSYYKNFQVFLAVFKSSIYYILSSKLYILFIFSLHFRAPATIMNFLTRNQETNHHEGHQQQLHSSPLKKNLTWTMSSWTRNVLMK